MHANLSAAPIAVGGVGGSGTRIVAAALREAGVFTGGDLNGAGDNLWFTLLFKYPSVLELSDTRFEMLLECFVSAMEGRPVRSGASADMVRELAARECDQHSTAWLSARAASLLGPSEVAAGVPWGWKEPNTHMVLGRLAAAMPQLRYVHVVRSGLDMALSDNQNQVRMWSRVLGLEADGTPAAALRFWCEAQRQAERLHSTMRDRFLWVRFEDLCDHPEHELDRILRFAGRPPSPAALAVAAQVHRPPSMGRGVRELDRIGPTEAQLSYLSSLGFATP